MSKKNKISNADKGMLIVLINLLLAELEKDEITFTKKQFQAAGMSKFSTESNKNSITLRVEKN